MAVIDSQGTIITINGTVVGGTRSLGGIGSGSPTERDRTTFADTSFKRFGMGLADAGTVTVGLLLDSADNGQRKAFKAWKDRSRDVWTFTFSNGVVQSCYAYTTQFSQEAGADQDVTGQIQLRIDGAISGFPDPS